MENPFEFLDVRDAADVLNISHHTLRHLLWRGDITYVKIGGRVMLRFPDLEKYVEGRTRQALPDNGVKQRPPTYAEELAKGSG